jgi:hypothetical protein
VLILESRLKKSVAITVDLSERRLKRKNKNKKLKLAQIHKLNKKRKEIQMKKTLKIKKIPVIDRMIAWENGELNDADTIKLFQEMINSGQVWHLQGCYGRMAQDLINAGACKFPKRTGTHDYYGNKIPSRKEFKNAKI